MLAFVVVCFALFSKRKTAARMRLPGLFFSTTAIGHSLICM